MTNKILNELAGKGKLPEIHRKAIDNANDAFFKRFPGSKEKGSAAKYRSAQAKASQADALDYANNDHHKGKKYWLSKAKKAGDKKRAWKVRSHPIKEALVNMTDKKLDEMKQNFEAVLAEMASEALTQRRTEIAREFVA